MALLQSYRDAANRDKTNPEEYKSTARQRIFGTMTMGFVPITYNIIHVPNRVLFHREFRKMGKMVGRAMAFQALLAVLFAAAACDKSKNSTPAQPGPSMGGSGGPPSPINGIMTKLAKGPQALNETIGRELKTDPPPWDAIQPQTKEYAQLASKLSQFDPPKGSKESWTKLTASYSETATALDRAADAKDKDAALAAHAALNKSCMGCHREHKAGPGGMRGPGGPPRPPQP